MRHAAEEHGRGVRHRERSTTGALWSPWLTTAGHWAVTIGGTVVGLHGLCTIGTTVTAVRSSATNWSNRGGPWYRVWFVRGPVIAWDYRDGGAPDGQRLLARQWRRWRCSVECTGVRRCPYGFGCAVSGAFGRVVPFLVPGVEAAGPHLQRGVVGVDSVPDVQAAVVGVVVELEEVAEVALPVDAP